MLRTPRCLNNVSSKARKCKSVTRGVKRHSVAVRPRSLTRHTGVKPIIPLEIEIVESFDQRQSQEKICQRTVLLNGVQSQLDDIVEKYSSGYSSSLIYKNGQNVNCALLSLSPSNIPNRRFLSTTSNLKKTEKNQEKVKLRDKVGPIIKSVPGKIRAGWRNYKSDIDMSRYEKWHWSLTPIKKIIFSYLVSVKIKNSIWGAIVHTWGSLKLFSINSKIGIKIGWRILKGEKVSIIERNRLRRALSDIFLMMPFSVFIIIPGAEIFIPLYVKLFPSALPKSFESLSQKQQRNLKQAQARLDLASFLHDTLNEVQKKQKAIENPSMVEFMKFTKEVRQGNRWVTNSDFKKFAPLFQEELTIDKMDRKTLDALCRIFKANPVQHRVVGAHGEFTQSTQLIRILLKKRIHHLKYEDQEYIEIINKSGIKGIPDEDLQDLNRDRGMRAAGLNRTRLEQQYRDWIELSSDPKISDSMLAYTRMLYMPKAVPKMADAMERAIEDKKPKTKEKEKSETKNAKEEIKEEQDFIDTAPVISEKPVHADEERIKLISRAQNMKITLKDIEAILESIVESKRILKPIASEQDNLNKQIDQIDDDLEDDRIELLNPAIVKKIEKISAKAEQQVRSMPVEETDVAVQCDLLATELRHRDLNEYTIGKVISFLKNGSPYNNAEVVRMMDIDGDGQISLGELEHAMRKIKEHLKEKNTDSIDCDKILKIMQGSSAIKLSDMPDVPPISSEKSPIDDRPTS